VWETPVCREHDGGTLARLLFDPIPTPQDLRPELPDDLSRVVVSLLQRDRDQRIPTASAAIAALVACADYPRNGREELITILAQRFAGRAPVRSRDVSHASPSDPTLIARPAVPAAPVTPAGPAWRTATAGPTPAPSSGLRPIPSRVRVRRRWLGAILAGVLVLGGAAAMVALVKLRVGEAVPVVPAPTAGPGVVPEPTPTTGGTRPGPMPAASVTEPEPQAVNGDRARGSASSTSGVPSAATSPERAPASRVPGRPPEGPAPRPGGILEIHL